MSTIDDLLAANADHAASYDDAGLAAAPSSRLAVVACMDARVDVWRALGLAAGQAHVIRNAGGVVTDDVLRSLVISQRKLGTSQIVLVHHTECGMTSFDGEAFADELQAETGRRPPFAFREFDDVVDDVRDSIAALRDDPFVDASAVRGFVYDVATGRLSEVEPPA